MITTYIRQAWHMLRQNRLFSAIYIAGTALAIATTTIFAIIYYVKIAPVYPESARADMAVIDRATHEYGGGMRQSRISRRLVDELVYKFDGVREATAWLDLYDDTYVKDADGVTDIKVKSKPTDAGFFRVYDYEFLAGRPFGDEEFASAAMVAVISDDLARKLFGTPEAALGGTVRLDYKDYRVCGVVRAGSAINTRSYGQVFTPYTTNAQCVDSDDSAPYTGMYMATVISDSPESLQEQTAEFERRFNTQNTDGIQLKLQGQPMTFARWALNNYPGSEFSWREQIMSLLLILLILLVVPALNLSGMISSRMDMRSAELGVRKAFGATRGRLLGQVLWENLLLTVIGGLLGLLLCWALLYASGGAFLSMTEKWYSQPSGPVSLQADMLFAPGIFAIVFGLCLLLNVLSAMLPAWMSLRRPIVQSLKYS